MTIPVGAAGGASRAALRLTAVLLAAFLFQATPLGAADAGPTLDYDARPADDVAAAPRCTGGANTAPASSCNADVTPVRGSQCSATPVDLLPTDHWAYEELEKLWVQGLIDSFFFSTRPVSRYDIARLLISLQSSAESEGSAPGAGAIRGATPDARALLQLDNSPSMQRLLREFSREMRALGVQAESKTGAAPLRGGGAEPGTGSTPLGGMGMKPGIDSSQRKAVYKETPFLFQRRQQNLDLRFSLYTDVTVDNWNQEDVDFADGSRAGFHAWAILWPNVVLFEDIYVGKLTEGWLYGEELFSLKDVLIFSDRFYVSLRAPFLDVTLGRDKLRWGPGITGTLLLSDGAPSYTLLSADKALGKRFKVSTVSGILDPEEGKYLAGHRVDIVPWNPLQIGLAETAIYHSRFVEPLYAISLIPFTLVERILHRDSQGTEIGDPLRNNVAVSTDFVLRARKGVSVYGELMVDDWAEETSKRPTKLAYQLGTAISAPRYGRTFNAIAELSRVWNYTYSVSYSEFYNRDDSHQGEPLGYYLGPDSRDVFVLISCDLSRDFEVGFTFNNIQKGEGSLAQPWREEMGRVDADKLSGIVETKRSIAPFVRWLPRDNILFEASAGLKQIENENHVENENDSGALFIVRLAARW